MIHSKSKQTVCVFLEANNSLTPGGQHFQLLALGQKLSLAYDATLACIVSGNDPISFCKDVLPYTSLVIPLYAPEYSILHVESYIDTLEALLLDKGSCLLLMADTTLSHSIAPKLACRFQADIISGAGSISIDRGTPVWGKVTADGSTLNEYILTSDISIVTVHSGIFKTSPRKADCGIISSVRSLSVSKNIILKSLKRLQIDNTLSTVDAEIVVSGGRGMGGPNGFRLIYQLASALNGAVAASRPAVDLGWISRSHQIGQTGFTISPRLYIACGISGALQHVSGMRNSDVIVAINSDPSAPIFKYADYAICGDVFRVLPEMIRAVSTHKNQI